MVPLWRKLAAGLTMSLIVAAWFSLSLTWLASPAQSPRPAVEGDPAPEDRALVERLRQSVNQGGAAELSKALAEMLPAPGEEEAWQKALAELSSADFRVRESAEAVLRGAGTRARGVIHRHGRFESDAESAAAISRLTPNLAGLDAASAALDALAKAVPAGVDSEVMARAVAYLPPMPARDRADRLLGARPAAKDAPPAVREARVRCMAAADKPWSDLAGGLADSDPGVRLAAALAGFERDEEEAVKALFALFPSLATGEARRVERLMLHRGGPGKVAAAVIHSGDLASVAKSWAEWWPKREARVAVPRESGWIVAQANLVDRLAILTRFDLAGKELDGIARPGEALACGFGADGEPYLARIPEDSAASRIESMREVGGPLVSVPGRLVAVFASGETWTLVARDRVEKVGPEGRQVLHKAPGRVISAAARAEDGWLALWHDDGTLLWIDSTGREKHRFKLPVPQGTSLGPQALPGRRVLVPLLASNRVAEFTDDGTEVDSVAVESPMAVRRLANGHWIVATPRGIIFLDAEGRYMRRVPLNGLPSGIDAR